jgi:hypothetical protein
MTNSTVKQQAVINTKEAMDIIISEAKLHISKKFKTSVEFVDLAIAAKNENIMSMMRTLVESGVNEAAASL